MPLSNASRLADFGTGIGTAGAIIQVDNANQRLGVGTTAPTATLGVAGIVSATAFYGDGSNLDGVASAGLGTALSETEFDPLAVIYQTSDTLSVGATITVDPPNATTKVAYTQYAEVKLEGDADLIVAEGDDFIPDILGLSTEGSGGGAAYGNNVFNTVYADNIEAVDGRGAPTFPKGIYVTSGVSTFTGNISIGGTLTYEDVTNVDSIGLITARSGIRIGATGDNTLISGAGSGIGIGVVGHDPLTKLHVQDSNNGALKDVFTITNQQGNPGTEVGMVFECGLDEVARISATNEGSDIGPLKFMTATTTSANPTEKLRIGSSGQIGLSGANYGTDGQVLTSKGGSAAVEWASPSSALTRIVGGTVSSSVSSIDMGTSIFSSTYQFYTLRVWLQGTSNIVPQLQLYIDGAWKTSDYSIQYYYSQGGGIINCNGVQGSKSGVNIGDVHGTGSPFNRKRYDWTANFSNMHSTDYAKTINVEFDTYSDNLDQDHTVGRISGGWNGSNVAVTGMRINTWNSGANFESGAWVIHGYN